MNSQTDPTRSTPPPTRRVNILGLAVALTLAAVVIVTTFVLADRTTPSRDAAQAALASPPAALTNPQPPPLQRPRREELEPRFPAYSADPPEMPPSLDDFPEPPYMPSMAPPNLPLQLPPPSPAEVARHATLSFSDAQVTAATLRQPTYGPTPPAPGLFPPGLAPGVFEPPGLPTGGEAAALLSAALPHQAPEQPTGYQQRLDSHPEAVSLHRQAAQPLTVPVGTLIPAHLLTTIDSTNPGEILAATSRDILDASFTHVLVPRGSKLVGAYDQAGLAGKNLFVAWVSLRLPSGDTYDLPQLSGTTPDGAAGLEGDRDSHAWGVLGRAVLLGVISAGLQLSQPPPVRGQEVLSAGQIGAGAVGQELATLSAELLRRGLPQPTITVPAGTDFQVFVKHPLVFAP